MFLKSLHSGYSNLNRFIFAIFFFCFSLSLFSTSILFFALFGDCEPSLSFAELRHFWDSSCYFFSDESFLLKFGTRCCSPGDIGGDGHSNLNYRVSSDFPSNFNSSLMLDFLPSKKFMLESSPFIPDLGDFLVNNSSTESLIILSSLFDLLMIELSFDSI